MLFLAELTTWQSRTATTTSYDSWVGPGNSLGWLTLVEKRSRIFRSVPDPFWKELAAIAAVFNVLYGKPGRCANRLKRLAREKVQVSGHVQPGPQDARLLQPFSLVVRCFDDKQAPLGKEIRCVGDRELRVETMFQDMRHHDAIVPLISDFIRQFLRRAGKNSMTLASSDFGSDGIWVPPL